MKEQLEKYIETIKADYLRFSGQASVRVLDDTQPTVQQELVKRFNDGIRYTEGKNYIKVISGGGVHSFIVKEDGPKFKKGDILKSASWAAPAKNKARGNIFETYHISWTGADYLR